MVTPPGWRREGNLPRELTSFVGRGRLLATLKRHLAESRLVTVTGIGGVGKSRTVLRLAHLVTSQYEDGVWFADLARLRDSGLVKQTLASALGIAEQTPHATSESLVNWVGQRNVLLILDTCEHLVAECSELIDELLNANPNLTVLATSRQSLHLPYERVLPVPPLAVPGDDPNESLFSNESVLLFSARAGAVVPDFTLDEQNIGVVAELCRRLDGIPLALELAAVRLRALSVGQILGLLADRFSLLAGASRTALPRHQTLRAAVGWSHELCEPAERLLWARLSVFSGDFELDAVRAICADERLLPEDVTDLVTGLVEKSILIVKGGHGGGRYRLIDTLAEYGEEWLKELGEAEAIRHLHLKYYLELAERGQEAWSGSGSRQAYWFGRMRQEHHNVRTALEHALHAPGESLLALKLVNSLWFMWVACGFLREGRIYLERVLHANPDLSKERCKALWVLSYVRGFLGDFTGMIHAAEQCSNDAVRIGDSSSVILASKMQGTAAFLTDDLQKASALLGVAIEFNTDNKELNSCLLPAIVELSLVLRMQGELKEGETLLEGCLQVCRERGELWVYSYANWAMAISKMQQGRPAAALEYAKESLRIKRFFHDTLGTLTALETAAQVMVALGSADLAARLLGVLQANWEAVSPVVSTATVVAPEHEQCVKECRKLLTDAVYEASFRIGRQIDLDEAAALAMDELNALSPAEPG